MSKPVFKATCEDPWAENGARTLLLATGFLKFFRTGAMESGLEAVLS